MFDQNELNNMVKKAQDDLQHNNVDSDTNVAINGDEDIYADFREESDVEYDNYDNSVNDTSNISEHGLVSGKDATNIPNNPHVSEGVYRENTRLDPVVGNIEPLYEGGPTKDLVDMWKKQWAGYGVFLVEIAEQRFMFRTLDRFEYRQLTALQNTNALQREEIICETVTLWPQNYKFDVMAKGMAGIPSTLAEIVMSKSGFTKEYSIQVI